MRKEATLSPTDRLGLAYCRLNNWEWDDAVGEKPHGFDEMPDFPDDGDSMDLMKRDYLTKHDFIHPTMEAIREMIGEANTSRCWWEFQKLGSVDEWFYWYCSTFGLSAEQVKRRRKLLENPPQQSPKRIREKGAAQGRKNGNSPIVTALRAFFFGCIGGILGFLLLALLEFF